VYLMHRDYVAYSRWATSHDTLNDAARHAIQDSIKRLPRLPLFSVMLLPAPGGGGFAWESCICSLQRQLYPFWELLRPANPDQADNHAALTEAGGEFVMPLIADARLAEHALYELVMAIMRDPDAQIVYGDQDCVSPSGERHTPWFKTGWDPDLALGRDPIGLPAIYQTTFLREVGGVRLGDYTDVLALYELALRAGYAASPSHIHHVPKILCHRTRSTDASPGWDADGARALVREHLTRSGIRAEVVPAALAPTWNWIIRELPDPPPLVSIIVPTRDRADLLECCVSSIFGETDYPSIELLIVDNDSSEEETIALLKRLSRSLDVKIVHCPGVFNYSAMNNRAVRQATGEVLVLLNNDTAVIRPDWLRELVVHAVRPDVGVVGARLLYPNGQVQHAGMVFQPGLGPVHQFRFAERGDAGPVGELALVRSVSIATGACLALRKSLYMEVDGMDEDLRVNFNDVDLCMRVGDQGYRNIWTPAAELFHFESASRGYDTTPEKQALARRESEFFRRRWGSLVDWDPFRNENLIFGWDRVELAITVRGEPLLSGAK
jgi:O-antigen biosynthesis protein